MTTIAEAKRIVLDHFAALDNAAEAGLAEALARNTSPDCAFRFVHPFNEATGPEAAAALFWQPLRQSFAPLQRRQDIFMAGHNRVDDGETLWVVSMGHLLGLFRKPFLGLRPTGFGTMIRYVEFDRIEDGRIVESTLFVDMLNLFRQVGAECLPAATGPVMVTPGPRTHDGLLYGDQPPEEGRKTIDLFMGMIDRLVDADVHTTREDLALDWHEDMIWWGPGGIGAPYTFDGYLAQHTGPFEAGLEWGRHLGHRMQIAEGHFGGFYGWPSLEMRSRGGYMGLLPESREFKRMRVLDLYRREGDRIAENWNIIDELHFMAEHGIDLVARQKMLTGL